RYGGRMRLRAVVASVALAGVALAPAAASAAPARSTTPSWRISFLVGRYAPDNRTHTTIESVALDGSDHETLVELDSPVYEMEWTPTGPRYAAVLDRSGGDLFRNELDVFNLDGSCPTTLSDTEAFAGGVSIGGDGAIAFASRRVYGIRGGATTPHLLIRDR